MESQSESEMLGETHKGNLLWSTFLILMSSIRYLGIYSLKGTVYI